MDYKRCPKKWFWAWRMGLVPKEKAFGALDLGTWVHAAFAEWYVPGKKRGIHPAESVKSIAAAAISDAASKGAPDYVLAKGEELAALAEAILEAYVKHYGKDRKIDVIHAETTIHVPVMTPHSDLNIPIAEYELTPDVVYRDENSFLWLLETKTAASIRTEHLVIDDQAKPYLALAEQALRRKGVISRGERLHGIMYNFLRKAYPDNRERNAEGLAVNKNGTVSKRQPPPYFQRYPVPATQRSKAQTLKRIGIETAAIRHTTQGLQIRAIDPDNLIKTPHYSCPKTCDFFRMCTVEEDGGNWRDMLSGFARHNPYDRADKSTTDSHVGFEMS